MTIVQVIRTNLILYLHPRYTQDLFFTGTLTNVHAQAIIEST